MAERALNAILTDINTQIKTVSFGGKITTRGLCYLQEKDEKTFPLENTNTKNGNKISWDDKYPLQTYHRILSVETESDPAKGFGNNASRTKVYSMRLVGIGSKTALSVAPYEDNQEIAKTVEAALPPFINTNEYLQVDSLEVIKQNVYDSEWSGVEIKKLSLEGIAFWIDYTLKIIRCESSVNFDPCASVGLQTVWDAKDDTEKNTFVDANDTEILTFIDSPLTVGILESIVFNTEKNKLRVVFTRIVTITDLTGISLSFIIGLAKTISSVSGSGTSTLIFTLNNDVSWGDLFDIDFSGSNVIDSESNNIGTVSSTIDATEVKPFITSEATMDRWYNCEDASLMFDSTGDSPSDAEAVYEVVEKYDPTRRKLGNNNDIGFEPTYDDTKKALNFGTDQWLTSINYNNKLPSLSQKFPAYAGIFHDFWKIEPIGTEFIFLKGSTASLEGIRIVSFVTVTMGTNTHTLRTFPTAATKIIAGNTIMLEMVRYDGAGTIEFFVTDSGGSRESLGTVTDTGTYEGLTVNNLIGTKGQFYLYQHRSYSTDERSNFASIHNEMNF